MPLPIVFHPEVKKDIASLPKAMRERIKTAIETRLTSKPSLYGKPLRGTLAGYWKLRVGDWRVVYAISGETVEIFAIKHRSLVYEEIHSRV